MSLGLFAVIVIELQRRASERVSVDELAVYACVPAERVRAVLSDIHAQGHCVLHIGLPGQLLGAQWLEKVPCA